MEPQRQPILQLHATAAALQKLVNDVGASGQAMLSHAQQRLPWQRQRSAGLLQQQHRRHLPFGHVAPSPLDRARSWALRTAAATGDHLQRRPMTVDLSGKWVKDKSASDSMEAAIDLIHLGGVVRQAVKLVKGVDIRQDGSSFTMAVFSVLPWFKVTERYSLDGSPSRCGRRDLRGGQHTGHALTRGESLMLSLEWGDPHGGKGTDVFELKGPGVLCVTSTLHVGGKTASYRTLYNKK